MSNFTCQEQPPNLKPGEFWVVNPNDEATGWHHLNAFDAGDAAVDIAKETYYLGDYPKLQEFVVVDAAGKRWTVSVRTEYEPSFSAERCAELAAVGPS